MLRLVVPRGKRFFSGVLILCADGEVEGPRGEELQNKNNDYGTEHVHISMLAKCNLEVNYTVSITIFTTIGDNGKIRLLTWL